MNSIQTKKNEMNLFKIVEDYFERMLEEVPGMKCLVLDRETMGIISLICSQSQILKKNVYLIETIEKASAEKLLHLGAIYFIRPTDDNMNKLIKEIKDPRFREYNIFLSNAISNLDLEKLAVEDEKNVIKKVIEVYADFYVVNQDLFSLNILNSSGFRKSPNEWRAIDETLFDRMVSGLVSLSFALRRIPYLRYQVNSPLCERLANRLSERFQNELKEATQNDFVQSAKPVLLLLERREDPVTPLLTQWTYQAMLHELLEIKNNRIDLRKDKDYAGKEDSEAEFVISQQNDNFFANHLTEDFGQLAESVRKELEEYSSVRKDKQKIDSIEAMQAVLDSMPELKRKSANISKHVTLTGEISKLVGERKLMEISRLEQEIAAKENKNEHFKSLMEILSQSYDKFDKLKLVLLFSLRYEADTASIYMLKDKLKAQGIPQEMVDLVDHVLKYAGKRERVGDLFANRNLLNKFTSKFKQALKDVPNVFTQHEPYICSLIDTLNKSKLKETEFASKVGFYINERPAEIKPTEIIIFIVGGATFEEAKAVAELNKKGERIILGGTNIINSKLFLGEINEFEKERNDLHTSFEGPSQTTGFAKKDSKGYGKFE